MNVALKFGGHGARVIFGATVFPEQVSRHDVDPLIRALRREDRRDQQFKRRRIVQRTTRVRVGALELTDDLARTFLLFNHSNKTSVVSCQLSVAYGW
jgi:hypothetical protein